MKSIFLTLPLLASAGTINKRQFDIFGLTSISTTSKAPIQVTRKNGSLYDGSVHEFLLWGPFKLNPVNGTHPTLGMTIKMDPTSDVHSSRLDGICQDCMILRAGADLAKKDGTKADIGSNVYSHHISIVSVGQPQIIVPIVSWCPNGMPGGFDFSPNMKGSDSKSMGGMSHGRSKRQVQQLTKPAGDGSPSQSSAGGGFLGAIISGISTLFSGLSSAMPGISILLSQGDEGTPATFYVRDAVIKSGFYVSKKDWFNMMMEVINYEKYERDIYLSLDYEYIPNMPSRPKEWLATGIGAVNVSPCDSSNLRKSP
jgi:hypothetical protein